MDRHITVPYDEKTARELKSGDMVYLTGTKIGRASCRERV